MTFRRRRSSGTGTSPSTRTPFPFRGRHPAHVFGNGIARVFVLPASVHSALIRWQLSPEQQATCNKFIQKGSQPLCRLVALPSKSHEVWQFAWADPTIAFTRLIGLICALPESSTYRNHWQSSLTASLIARNVRTGTGGRRKVRHDDGRFHVDRFSKERETRFFFGVGRFAPQ